MPSRFYASFDGNLTDDIKFGKSRKGDRKAEFTIAHSSYLTDEDGYKRDDVPTKFFRCITTDKTIVDSLERNETIGKGTRVSVSGTIQFDSFISDRTDEEMESNMIFVDNIGVDLRFSEIEWSKSAKKKRRSRDEDEDDRPRKKPRRSRDEDEDEEDEKPRRKPRRSRDEDEDEDDRPRKKPRRSRDEEEDEEEEAPRKKPRRSAPSKSRDEDEAPRNKSRSSARKNETDEGDDEDFFGDD